MTTVTDSVKDETNYYKMLLYKNILCVHNILLYYSTALHAVYGTHNRMLVVSTHSSNHMNMLYLAIHEDDIQTQTQTTALYNSL